MRNKKNYMSGNYGFSLIELIVVVLIMGILAVAITPQVIKWVSNARKANDMKYMDSLVTAVQLSLMSEAVNLEVSTELGEAEGTIVLVVDEFGTHDPVTHVGVGDSKLLKKTAETLGFGTDVESFKKQKLVVIGAKVSITISEGGHVTGTYTITENGSTTVVDLSTE